MEDSAICRMTRVVCWTSPSSTSVIPPSITRPNLRGRTLRRWTTSRKTTHVRSNAKSHCTIVRAGMPLSWTARDVRTSESLIAGRTTSWSTHSYHTNPPKCSSRLIDTRTLKYISHGPHFCSSQLLRVLEPSSHSRSSSNSSKALTITCSTTLML
ncbi:hypothetical protein K402DRAFT_456392, partial [Aulographum hederae CBS 113979]